jgi:hypothetical protein
MMSKKSPGDCILRKIALLFVLIFSLMPTLTSVSAVEAQEHTYTWSEPVMLSENLVGAWFPDVAVDNAGKVHVVWEQLLAGREKQSGNVLHSAMHVVFSNGSWSEPNDVFSRWSPPGVIYRLALAADNSGHTNMTILLGNQISFLRSVSDASHSASAWSEPDVLSGGGVAYMSDIATDSRGTIHVVWQQTVPGSGGEESILTEDPYDIFYRRSEDGGRTWSAPVNLSNTPVSEGRPQVKIDDRDTVYVTWDEGGLGPVVASGTEGTSYRGVLVFSQDGGKTWLSPSKFFYPGNTNSQIASASNGQGGVLVVWRSQEGLIYYDWSEDWGKSWLPPAPIPRILAYSRSGFDAYDMAVDSAGTIHLVAAGQLSKEYPSRGIYHMAWDGKTWSSPVLIYDSERRRQDPLVGMYPKIAVSQGNQLHVVWHTHAESNYGERYIWYSSSQSPAPPQALPPTPTLTPMPSPVPAEIVALAPVSASKRVLASTQSLSITSSFDPSVIYTENDDVLLLLASLVPSILIVLGAVVIRRSQRRK